MLQSFFKVEEKWTKIAKETAAAADATKVYGDATVAANTKAQNETKKTEKAIKAVNTELLSMQELADKGGKSENARFAREAVKLRERAAKAEAAGKFEQADALNKRADELEKKTKRRELVGGRNTTDASAKLREDAKRAELRGDADGAKDLRDQADQLDKQTAASTPKKEESLYDKMSKASIYAADEKEKAKLAGLSLEDYRAEAAKLNSASTEVGKDGTVAESTDNKLPAESEGSSSKGQTIMEKLEVLINLLTALPDKLGVA
jgi:hypothetical protein